MKRFTFHKSKGKEPIGARIFVVDWNSLHDCHRGNVMTYSPIGQHGEGSIDYVTSQPQITRKQYKELSQGIYTPEEYLTSNEKAAGDKTRYEALQMERYGKIL